MKTIMKILKILSYKSQSENGLEFPDSLESFNLEKKKWFDAQLGPLGIDRTYLEESGA